MCDRCATLNEPFGKRFLRGQLLCHWLWKLPSLLCRRRPWSGSQAVAQEDLIVKILVKKIKDRKHLQIRMGYAVHTAVHDETDMTYDMCPVCTNLRYFWMIYSDATLPLRLCWPLGISLDLQICFEAWPGSDCDLVVAVFEVSVCSEWLASFKVMIARCAGASYTQS